jgi:glycosyltransferase involved in cell wall biosynthesis
VRDQRSPRLSGLSIVLPAYNEAESLPVVVARALEALQEVARMGEVIVVNDGSRDDTGEVARRLVEEHHPRVRLLEHPVNQGYGAAIRSGFNAAGEDYVFYTDADNQFDLLELRDFAPMIAEHDAVIGFRVYRYDSVKRSILSWGYNRLVGVLFRVRVRDVDCAYKLFRREVVDKVTIESNDFFVDAELVAKARKWNFRIAERGVRHYPRAAGETTVHASDIPNTLRTVARMWRRVYLPTRQMRAEAEATRELAAAEVLPQTRV